MPAPRAKGELRPVLIACCLAMLAVGDNSTAIMAALPDMKGSLQLGPAELEWVVNAYLLTAAIFIIVGGGAADQLGARRSSVIGIALFALASLLIALAPAGFVVIGARALQGLGESGLRALGLDQEHDRGGHDVLARLQDAGDVPERLVQPHVGGRTRGVAHECHRSSNPSSASKSIRPGVTPHC